ncbi:ubiquitinyl hydrolase [Wallemia mellicola]|nr:ubiquitinyl hydrolase [Wallemia mellicola]TIC01680.1 ubiquitinyl hydrolase [Wallemia mellicola]TIC12107.1 ubiquitinyl hydrolase [Wallemia mellicola]TIC50294.1 ubiquitinyl hydrolase [Wallemia mellicola]
MGVCEHVETLGPSLRAPSISDTVYKDECMRCFDSQDSENGVDVCLHCFHGGCATTDNNSHQHAYNHAKEKNHPLAVNIKRRIKKSQVEKEEPPLKKLAIEEERDEDIHSYDYNLKCLECNAVYPSTSNSTIESQIDAVVKADSNAHKSEVKAWEEELTGCEHSVSISQTQVPKKDVQMSGAHCHACELSDNLWLCLTCGELGCGRAQFGGLKGNSHALAHFENTGHAVAVKLGTITAEGSADIYCYACNEERLNPNLATDLSNFGINIAAQVKTTKNLTELQLEQNSKFDFSMTGEDGQELQPVFGNWLTGLKNLGNSCYMNSTIQSLFSYEEVKKYYSELFAKLNKETVDDPANNLDIQLAKIADGLGSGRYSKQSRLGGQFQDGIKPAMFKNLIGKGHPEFSSMRQQDSEEFLSHFLEVLRRTSKNTPKDLKNMFAFVAEQKLQCTSCNKVRYRYDNHDSLSVNIPVIEKGKVYDESSKSDKIAYEDVDMQDCLSALIQPEQLEYSCPSCQTQVNAIKTWKLDTFPNALVIHSRKFHLVNWVPTKLDIQVNGVEKVDVTQMKSQGRQEGEVDLPDSNDDKDDEIKFDGDSMTALTGMGFSENRSKRALINTNHSGAEAAMEWLFSHMEDEGLDEPVEVKKTEENQDVPAELINTVAEMGFTQNQARKALKSTQNSVEMAVGWLFENPTDPGEEAPIKESSKGGEDDLINVVTSMGFTENQARKALRLSSNNVEMAVSWLFENPTDAGEEAAEPMDEDDSKPGHVNSPASYKLKAFISHKGPSVHSGHYVVHVKHGDNWILFNDEKVVKESETNLNSLLGKGYVYFYEKI